jgi:ribosomal protein S18 acetylase RimI-like enzyme
MYMDKRLIDNYPGCYVAVNGSEVVGCTFCDILRDPTGSPYGYISNVMIKQDFRGAKIGERLLRAAVQYLTIAGVPRIWANVREENEAMVHLFNKSGFARKIATYELKVDPMGV